MTISVQGIPAPQGSKAYRGMRRGKNGQAVPILVESSAKVKPWREAVKWEVRERHPHIRPFTGPVSVKFWFYMPRPKSAKGKTYQSTRPDIDKLVRSTLDALTESGVFLDDGQVSELYAVKFYADEEHPSKGADIVVIER